MTDPDHSCTECGGGFESASQLAKHRIDAHGLAPRGGKVLADDEAAMAALARERFGAARKHADRLEMLSSFVGVLIVLSIAVAAAIVVTASEKAQAIGVIVPALVVGGIVWGALWGILRAAALHLHLTVDRAMVEGLGG